MEKNQINPDITRAKIGPYIIGKDIDEIIIINLETRKDRREQIMDEMKNYPYRFFTAKLHECPAIGCLESHLTVWKYAIDKNYKNILVLEDDCIITKDLNEISEFPLNWDIITFGGLVCHIYHESVDDWFRCKYFSGHAQLFKVETLQKIYEEIKDNKLENFESRLDHYMYVEVHEKYNCFASKEPYIIQREGHSDLDNKVKWTNFKWPKVGEKFYVP